LHLIKTAKLQAAVLTAAYGVIWSLVLYRYLPLTSLNFLLGALALLFTINKSDTGSNYRYAVVASICIAASVFIPVKTFVYFSIGFSVFFFIESLGYRLGYMACSVLAFMSPMFQYFSNVFSFPIRLQLTEWSGKIFKIFDAGVGVKGNIIYNEQAEFSVDPACMGLNMLTASVLLSIMLLRFYQTKYGKRIRGSIFSLFIVFVIGFNIISNLIRIVVLVHFTILPDSIMHELTGIACMLLYVVVPAAFVARFISVRSANSISTGKTLPGKRATKPIAHYLLLAAIVFAAYRTNHVDTFKKFENKSTVKIAGFTTTNHSPGIVKLEHERALVYVKYIRGFYDTEHNPTICWSGSGYGFQFIKEETISNEKVYTALLVNGKERLATAWWYTNGNRHVTDQLDWRWNMVRGEKGYALINVTAANETDRRKAVEKIIGEGLFKELF
jgi:exosortase N